MDISSITGIGKSRVQVYRKLFSRKIKTIDNIEPRVLDLLFHVPEKIASRKLVGSVKDINEFDIIIAKLEVLTHNPPLRPKQPYTITCYLGNDFISVVFYRFFKDYVGSKFKIGSEVFVSGKVEMYNSQIQIVHPDYVCSSVDQIPILEPIYSLTSGLANREICKNMQYALESVPDLPEWLDADILRSNGWCGWKNSLLNLHRPKTIFDPKNCGYIARLAFDELLAQQLALALAVGNSMRESNKDPLPDGDRKLKNKLMDEILPFKLTKDQSRALDEIESDTFSSRRMMRLLQGDVGSGKTIVAFIAMLNYVENGGQCVIMVPTTILAVQHFNNMNTICQQLSINMELLTSNIRGVRKKNILGRLKSGDIDILVGTHAIIEENIEFKKLAFVVIDEQHRFGVKQRLKLVGKNKTTDILTMTATPIPRTLALVLYSGMNLSILGTKPIDRKKIITALVSTDKYSELTGKMKDKIEKNEKIYWICPLVEENENTYLSDVRSKYEEFCDIFGESKVALIHGKMSEKEKDSIMEEFCNCEEGRVLVSTTVIEVGIDVKDATVIVIEYPERFGLSQLHQLRGRVGRGVKQSYCVLLYSSARCSKNALERLNTIRSTDDGFTIAEKDLKIRGIGEVVGDRQSGMHDYIFADLGRDFHLLERAIDLAKTIWREGRAADYSNLLHLFGYVNCLGDTALLN
jgi:ATP-dependent DNA helicase RecG